MALSDEDREVLTQYALLRGRGMNHHAAVAAINLVRVLADQPELDDATVRRLKRAIP